MYNIITLEVLESFNHTVQSKLFGHKHIFNIEHKAGDKMTVKRYISEDIQKLIDEGVLKIIKSTLQEN